jgi:hypothetical protein
MILILLTLMYETNIDHNRLKNMVPTKKLIFKEIKLIMDKKDE